MTMKEGFEGTIGKEQMQKQASALNEGKIPEGQPNLSPSEVTIEQQDINDALLPDDGRKPYPDGVIDPEIPSKYNDSSMSISEDEHDWRPTPESEFNWKDIELDRDNRNGGMTERDYVQEGSEGSLSEGKAVFYPKAEADLKDNGFEVYGEKEYTGQSKPDYLATKNGESYVGEIKSPNECETSKSGWLADQPYDSERMKNAREHARQRVDEGVPREVAAHEAVINGQIPDYADKIRDGRVHNLPDGIEADGPMKGAYTVPTGESGNVEAAFEDLGIDYEKIEGENGSVTYTYDLSE
jgi:hypothetical protein